MENVKKKMTCTGINDFDYSERSVRNVKLKLLETKLETGNYFYGTNIIVSVSVFSFVSLKCDHSQNAFKHQSPLN